jgi:hypothetical protein
MAALHAWLKVLNAIGGLAAISERMIASRARVAPREPEPTAADDLESIARGPGDPLAHLGQIETRLAGVVVAALKEAFDRDRARLDLERHHLDAERERADRALRQERRRLAGERALSEVRLLAILNVAVWLASAVLITWHGGTDPATRILLGVGWGSLVAGVACALAAHARLQALFAAGDPDEDSVARSSLATAATWLLVVGLGLVAASVLTAM